MKGIHGALLNLLGAMGRMKVRGLPRALVIVLMLLIIGSILLYWAGHRSHRLHREEPSG
ncbi:hypothetical protein [Acidaminococcus fermentans]|uniref:hypothetical protein n=1 Tax=Acidaminococcus fermentans TaxID=905 RepID=UPI003078CF34